ncbi:GNAT family N-acetyltransferase [Actinoalloteichus caeruleus]|uniref:GNAT family N-acetyltransferase n=1 Tax=Actinoalloteichus cyanogriseus TaxID=2893586 RepID=UPI003AAF6371
MRTDESRPHPAGPVFEFDAGALGLIALHPLVPAADVDLVHRWVTQDRARFWGMTGLSRAEVLDTYRYVDSLPTHHAFLARRRGVPVGLVQTYEPAEDPMGDYYEVRRGDIGFHLFSGPPAGDPERGFTSALLAAVVAFVSRDPAVRRVVAEPDARNAKVLDLLRRNGFDLGPELRMADKTARLAVLDLGADQR